MPVQMFFSHNTALVPPYNCLVDTNFITYDIQRPPTGSLLSLSLKTNTSFPGTPSSGSCLLSRLAWISFMPRSTCISPHVFLPVGLTFPAFLWSAYES